MRYDEIAREKAGKLISAGHARILAIESSCDETSAAVVDDGRIMLSNPIASQIKLHEIYGGVVPEIASRMHVEAVDAMVDQALEQANCSIDSIDAIAVTQGPGLVGALLTGVAAAKALAMGRELPLIAVNHIEGHVSANYIASPELEPPFLCLVVSGGHTHLVVVRDYGVYELIGQTVDDAAGEAFDKVARILGLPYPGGPKMDEAAHGGNDSAYTFPKPLVKGSMNFSFSGIKTAAINLSHKLQQQGVEINRADFAASYRKSVVEALVERTREAARMTGMKRVAMAGGVSANSLLRSEMQRMCQNNGLTAYMPPLRLCTDNAAMIGSAAFYRLMRGEIAALDLNAMPMLTLDMSAAQDVHNV